MIFDVEIQPHRGGHGFVTRHVHVPDAETAYPAGGPLPVNDLLDAVFRNGQNDFQPLPCPSVSVGDVICIPSPTLLHETHRYLVVSMGFERLADDRSAREQHMQAIADVPPDHECTCESKWAQGARRGGWLVCARPECGGRIG